MTSHEDKVTVCVLGCGPAGLLAAQAAASLGLEAHIVSHKVKSKIAGAQFLHEPIPGITEEAPDFIIDVRHLGHASDYARKVYGSEDAPTSWSEYDGAIPAFDLRKSYDLLWDVWVDEIRDLPVTGDVVSKALDNYDFVVSSVPLPILAEAVGATGDFRSQSVWISDKLTFSMARNCIIYNGEAATDWYRASHIGGHGSMEYGFDPGFGLQISKPLDYTFEQESAEISDIVLVGRYGRWEKGVLVHHAYTQVLEELS